VEMRFLTSLEEILLALNRLMPPLQRFPMRAPR
jgi:hypothetical protein